MSFPKLGPRIRGVRPPVPVVQNIRLYAAAGVPVSLVDTTTNSLFVGPYQGNIVTLLDSSDMPYHQPFTETSLALSGLTSGRPYDVFVYQSGKGVAIELSAAFAGATSRTDALATVNGVVVKSSNHTRLFVGTFYSTNTNETVDQAKKRFVWNNFNRMRQSVVSPVETTDTWSLNSGTIRQANNSAANRVEFVVGDDVSIVDVHLTAGGHANGASAAEAGIGVGLDSTTTFIGHFGYMSGTSAVSLTTSAGYTGLAGTAGYHAINWLEYGHVNTWVFYGDAGTPTKIQTGLRGTIMC